MMLHSKKTIFTILFVLAVLITTIFNCIIKNKVEKENAIAIDATFLRIVGIKELNVNLTHAMTFYQNGIAEKINRLTSLQDTRRMNDYLQLEKYSNIEIMSRLRVIKLKDEKKKIKYILDMAGDGYDNLDIDKITPVLFENGNRSMVFFPCRLNRKIIFLDMFKDISHGCIKYKFSYYTFNSLAYIEYEDFGINYKMDFKKSVLINTDTDEVFKLE